MCRTPGYEASTGSETCPPRLPPTPRIAPAAQSHSTLLAVTYPLGHPAELEASLGESQQQLADVLAFAGPGAKIRDNIDLLHKLEQARERALQLSQYASTFEVRLVEAKVELAQVR